MHSASIATSTKLVDDSVRIETRTEGARVSVIVPSWKGEIARLRASLEAQTYHDYELIVVVGVSPASRARNLGAARARGEIIVFVDDDAYFGHERVLETLVEKLASDPTLAIVGPSKLLPPDASDLQRRIADEVPRWVYPVEREDTESNPPLDHYGYTGITTTCCGIRRATFEAANGFDESLPTGPEDTDFFYRIRRTGGRFLIPANCWTYHDPPKRIGALLRKSFHYGIGHALEARKNPERGMAVIPLNRWYGKFVVALSPLLFPPSLFISLYFDPTRHLRLGFRPLKALSSYATLYGYTWGWFRDLKRRG